ncbi:MAG: 23S rRNA pseudouridine synthase [Erysipelotrichaceae bacterium]|nr:MAG: 23S rRNA pseudouridine [Erysipelotrichaceae bacterium]TXT18504.1 MAG: 23S rRNA pseudouridine synthase [Erysipelotrichaceae bacterium]
MKIIYEDNHLLVIEKPINIPMQEDESKDKDLLSLCKAYLKEKYHKPGNVYCGMVHRLDRPVGGVAVFAKTSKAASRLSESIRTDQFNKVYKAILVGQLPKERTLIDHLIKDEKTNTSKVTSSTLGKYSELRFKVLNSKETMHMVEIQLITGRSHQIRVQFSSRSCPIWGDARYNPNARPGQQLALWATSLSFPHPITQEIMHFKCELPRSNPWDQFE